MRERQTHVRRARRSTRARTTARTRTAPQAPPQTQAPRVVYAQVASDDADARIAEALKLLARAGAFDA
jgi:hypothetical protein